MVRTISFYILCCFLLVSSCKNKQDDGYELWLKYENIRNKKLRSAYRKLTGIYMTGNTKTHQIIRQELQRGLGGMVQADVAFVGNFHDAGLWIGLYGSTQIVNGYIAEKDINILSDEGFLIRNISFEGKDRLIVTAKSTRGLLYGVYHLLRSINTGTSIAGLNSVQNPKIRYRLLNHWDNLDGSVERGYAGNSLWKWDRLPDVRDRRYTDYARANASIGINGTVLNNVNANPVFLTTAYLEKVAVLADIFRPYGIRVFLSVNFSSPMSGRFNVDTNRTAGIGNLQTSDPLDPKVQNWWRAKAGEIYRLIPDFGGFLVKANSEGMPGPQDYDHNHAEGANMLAGALAPFGGVVMWRAFVYDADVDADRAKRSYKEFVPLDGRFEKNVFVQAKNGPIDFQPREPVQPLFGAMPQTPLMLELQITQEYLGHSTHLVYLAPMWKEYLQFDTCAQGAGTTLASIIDGSAHRYHMTGVAGVANTGSDRNWCGHFFAQANWYAFGRLAWDNELTAQEIAREWIKQSLGRDQAILDTVTTMMLGSWEACVNYMTPLGLHHIMQEGFHYGPQPDLAESGREDWTSVYYHRADNRGLGFDRTASGSHATAQYFEPLSSLFEDIQTCPEKYLLWFHHVDWDYKMKSGRSLRHELVLRYHSGTEYVDATVKKWEGLEGMIGPVVHKHVHTKLLQQQHDAKIWRETCLTYFQQFSGQKVDIDLCGNR